MKKIFNEVRRLPEFDKDFKKLAKRFKTLDDDIETFISKQLKLTHKLRPLKNGNFFSSSRKAKISTTGIYRIFRGLKFEPDAEIGQKVPFCKGLKLGIDNESVVHISELGIEIPKIYKAIKFACKALKGRGAMSGIRIIYAYYENEDVIEFIEIYFKGDKANEDEKRIMKYYS